MLGVARCAYRLSLASSALLALTSSSPLGLDFGPLAGLAPQESPAIGPQTFRSSAVLVEIDAVVKDADGQFVKGLMPADFEIVEDGQSRPPSTAALIDLPLTAGQAGERSASQPDVPLNSGGGRLYVLVMDSPSTSGPTLERAGIYAAVAQRVATQFIDEFMLPGDLAAVVHTLGTASDAQALTSSKPLLLKSIRAFGRGLSGDLPDSISGAERVQRHLETYRVLKDVSDRLEMIGARRKSILWIGAQLRFQMPACPPGAPLSSAHCQLQARWGSVVSAHREAMASAAKSNATIYAIDPLGLTTAVGADELDRRAALQMVAEESGGVSIVGTNNFRAGFQQVVRENSTYYILGYEPRQADRADVHAIEVRVKRPGRYSVRARRSYRTAHVIDEPTHAGDRSPRD